MNKPSDKCFHLKMWSRFSICFAIGCFGLFFGPRWEQGDFKAYWQAAYNLVHGENAYQLYTSYRVWSPPFSIAVLTPFGYFDHGRASELFVFLWYAILSYSFLTLLRLERVSFPQTWGQWLIILAAIPFGAMYESLHWWAVGFLTLFGIVLFLESATSGRYFYAGFSFFFFLLKPYLLLPLAIFTLGWAWSQRHVRFFIGVLCAMASSLALVLSHDPNAFSDFVTAGDLDIPFSVHAATIPNLIFHHLPGNPKWFLFLPSIALSVAALILAFRKPAVDLYRTWVIFLPFSVFLAPYGWGHEYLLCMPTFVSFARYILTSPTLHGTLRFGLIALLVSASLFQLALAQSLTNPHLQTLVGLAIVAMAWKLMPVPCFPDSRL